MELPVSIPCPSCKARLKIKKAALVGKTVKCPKCGERFAAEAPNEPGKTTCDIAEGTLVTPPLPAGRATSKAAGADSKPGLPAPRLPASAFQPVAPVCAPTFTAPTVAAEPPARRPSVDALWYAGTVVFALLLVAGLAIFASVHEMAMGIQKTQQQQNSRMRNPYR
jgi:predicted Zn finger-like uncharacterized protein